MKIAFLGLLFFIIAPFSIAQQSQYSLAAITDSLINNANAIVRLNQVDLTILSQRSMNVKTIRVVSVLNSEGLEALNAYEFYDKSTIIKNIEAIVYDAFGNEIKKIKRKDFKDQSAAGGGTLFSDNRVLFLNYTPISYPFTVAFTSEILSSSTAFLPRWMPLTDFYTSIEKSILNVTYPNNLGFKKKATRSETFNVKKTADSDTNLSYVATGIVAQKEEPYSPSMKNIWPKVIMGLEQFHLEGVDGEATNWKDFGKWYSEKILIGTTDLSIETKLKIQTLVGDEKDIIKKAQLIYDYVQKKSRYVSIQVGIGGWKPMLAKDVDRLGYGDCKALTNYTKALLQLVDIPAYNTILYGGRQKTNIESDFVSMQGNHMILAIPNGNDYIWLECTSQVDPFGYLGTFTDDRDVLVIKPEGGEIVKTKTYEDKGNSQVGKGSFSIDENGDFSGNIKIISEGSQYSSKSRVEQLQPTEKEVHYKTYWGNIGNLQLEKTTYTNDKEHIQFVEDIQLKAQNYGAFSSNKLFIRVNAFNQNKENIKRIRTRKTPFLIQRGYLDTDEIEINLPTGFAIEFLPPNFALKNKFGEYKSEIIKTENNKLTYKRSIYISNGQYSNKDYDDYRVFMEEVTKYDASKIILTKI